MTRTPAHRAADERYSAKIIRSPSVKFRTDSEHDMRLVARIRAMPDFSAWLRDRLAEIPATDCPDTATCIHKQE